MKRVHYFAAFSGQLLLSCILTASLASSAQTRIYETNAYVETIAGSGFYGYLDGQSTATMFNNPKVTVVDSATNVYVWDSANYRIRKITPDGAVTTFAGSGYRDYLALDGQGTNASFYDVSSMLIGRDGNIWLYDYTYVNGKIRLVTTSANVTTLCTFSWGYRDGPLSNAQFSQSIWLAADNQGGLFVSDTGNRRIRKIDTNLVVSTFAGSGNSGYQDGAGIFCSFNNPTVLAVDPSGNIFVADSGQHSAVRKITPQGIVTAFAAGPYGSNSGDDGMGTNASFYSYIDSLAVDSLGNIYVADSELIRKINAGGLVTTLAGFGNAGYSDGQGRDSRFSAPTGLSLDGANRIYVADRGNQRIRRISYGQVPTNDFSISMYAGLSLVGAIGRSYRIDYTTSISNSTGWTSAATITLTSSPYLWFDPNSAGRQKRFYRAVALP
ncbi:MAG: hypothetical protein HZA90_06125 [Verrucomicrobia bacterium]|nr:hypothetical protein [Verrucomicrobiota bacterium]